MGFSQAGFSGFSSGERGGGRAWARISGPGESLSVFQFCDLQAEALVELIVNRPAPLRV